MTEDEHWTETTSSWGHPRYIQKKKPKILLVVPECPECREINYVDKDSTGCFCDLCEVRI